MRSSKRYTNATFTRRVDHDGGRHRGDKAPKEPLVCTTCGSVYSRRRWAAPSDERAGMLQGVAEPTLCPACQMREQGQFGGHLTVTGAFLDGHRDDIEALLRAEAQRAFEDNPTGQILTWDGREPRTITITTSTEHLVQRLGHALKKAYGGEVDYGFSHENKLARATWRRD